LKLHCLGTRVDLAEIVRDSLDGSTTFLDRFVSPMEVEQAQPRKPRGDNQLGRIACQPTSRDSNLHDVHR